MSWADGTPTPELLILYSEDGKRNGPARIWGPNGTRQLYAQFTAGKENGITCVFRSGVPWYLELMSKGDVSSAGLVRPKGSALEVVDVKGLTDEDSLRSLERAREKLAMLCAAMKTHENAYRKECLEFAEKMRRQLAGYNAQIKRKMASARAAHRDAENAAALNGLTGGGHHHGRRW